ncbi:hypothetical protein HY504_00700 [Candidatus Wolfebacteria bacterium]|nr:hypothetical protein [Candidatus Wolfebacteria bacterium]
MGKLMIRKNSAAYKILKYLAIGSGVLVLGAIAPVGTAHLVRNALRDYFRKKKFERGRMRRDMKGLHRRGFVDYREKEDGAIEIRLTT